MKEDRKKRRDYFRKQKLIGLGVIVFSIMAMWLGVAIKANDCGILILAIPAGLYLIFTKDMIMDFGYKLEVDKRNKQTAH